MGRLPITANAASAGRERMYAHSASISPSCSAGEMGTPGSITSVVSTSGVSGRRIAARTRARAAAVMGEDKAASTPAVGWGLRAPPSSSCSCI